MYRKIDDGTSCPIYRTSYTAHYCHGCQHCLGTIVFGGNGTENRLNLVLRVSEDVIKTIRAAEQECSSSIISDEADRSTIKVKVEMDKLNVWGSDNTPAPKPTQWRGVDVKAMLEIRGFWKSKTGEGLTVVCTDLQIADIKPKTSPF